VEKIMKSRRICVRSYRPTESQALNKIEKKENHPVPLAGNRVISQGSPKMESNLPETGESVSRLESICHSIA
jgi:hypothetical protein